MKKDLIYIVLIFSLLFIVFNCNGSRDFLINDRIIKIDTVLNTIDTIKIKQDPIIIKEDSLVYKIDYEYTNKITKDLKEKIDSIKTEKNRIEYLLNILSVKEYDTTYFFGKAELNLKEKVQGKILNRDLTFIPNDFFVKQTISVEKTKLPSFILSGGIYTQVGENADIGLELGYRNFKGYQFEVGSNLKDNFQFSIKKDIFIKK